MVRDSLYVMVVTPEESRKPTPRERKLVSRLEKRIDAELAAAGWWPATVLVSENFLSDEYSLHVINAVRTMYQSAGWMVEDDFMLFPKYYLRFSPREGER